MTEGRPRESGEEGSCGGPVPAAVRASALFATTIQRPPSAPPSARAFEASVLKAITSGLFDDEAENDTDEDSVAGLPTLPPMKGRSVLRVRRSLDECNDDAASHLSEGTAVTPSCALSAAFSQDLSIHTPRRGSCDTSATTAGLPPLPGTPGAGPTAAALRACKKLRPSLDFGSRAVTRTSPDWGAPPPFPAAAAAAAAPACGPPAPAPGAAAPVPRSLPSVSLAGLLPDQVEHAIGAAKRAAPGGRGPLGLRLDTAALVRELNAARGAAAGRRFSACF